MTNRRVGRLLDYFAVHECQSEGVDGVVDSIVSREASIDVLTAYQPWLTTTQRPSLDGKMLETRWRAEKAIVSSCQASIGNLSGIA